MNSPDFFPVKNPVKQGENPVVQPYDITIGLGTRFMDASVTGSNLKNAAVQFSCKLATHSSVFVQRSLAKQHLINQVDGSPQSVTEGKLRAKGKGWRQARATR